MAHPSSASITIAPTRWDDGAIRRKDAPIIGAPLDLAVELLYGSNECRLFENSRKAHEGEDVDLGLVEQDGEIRGAWRVLIGDVAYCLRAASGEPCAKAVATKAEINAAAVLVGEGRQTARCA